MEYSTVNKNSWHFKLINKIVKKLSHPYFVDEKYYPRSECTYFWTVIYFMIGYPFFRISEFIRTNILNDISNGYNTTLFNVMMEFGFLSFLSLSNILSVAIYIELFTNTIIYPATENTFLVCAMVIPMLMGVLGVLIQIVVITAGVSYGIGYLIERGYKKFKEFDIIVYYPNNPKIKKDSLFSHFKQWVTSKKKKLCKPIKYED